MPGHARHCPIWARGNFCGQARASPLRVRAVLNLNAALAVCWCPGWFIYHGRPKARTPAGWTSSRRGRVPSSHLGIMGHQGHRPVGAIPADLGYLTLSRVSGGVQESGMSPPIRGISERSAAYSCQSGTATAVSDACAALIWWGNRRCASFRPDHGCGGLYPPPAD